MYRFIVSPKQFHTQSVAYFFHEGDVPLRCLRLCVVVVEVVGLNLPLRGVLSDLVTPSTLDPFSLRPALESTDSRPCVHRQVVQDLQQPRPSSSASANTLATSAVERHRARRRPSFAPRDNVHANTVCLQMSTSWSQAQPLGSDDTLLKHNPSSPTTRCWTTLPRLPTTPAWTASFRARNTLHMFFFIHLEADSYVRGVPLDRL